jgi:hypothetical protein
VNIDHIGSHPYSNLCLILKLLHGSVNDVRTRRVQDDKLIGMKTSANVMRFGELTTRLELFNNLAALREVAYFVAAFGVRLQGKDLAVNPKRTNSVVGTESQRCPQSLGVR